MGLSKSQAVSAAKLIKQAQKSGQLKKNLPHAGTILVATQTSRATKRHSKNGLSTAFVVGSDWSFNFDAGLLVDALRLALLVLYRTAILQGEKPDGSGAQPKLNPRVAAQRGRRGKTRGYKTGFMADNLRASKITGSTTKASSRILPPTNRNVYIAEEAKRGISFFSVTGIAAIVIADVTNAFIEGGAVNVNRAADPSEVDSKQSS
jgi:hypothetical protein